MAKAWIEQIWDTKQASEGGVARRHIVDVQNYASLAELVAEAQRRKHHVVQVGNQVIVIFNDGRLQMHC